MRRAERKEQDELAGKKKIEVARTKAQRILSRLIRWAMNNRVVKERPQVHLEVSGFEAMPSLESKMKCPPTRMALR